MGQQQLLLLVLGIVIVGLAVVVGIEAFSENQKKANMDAMVSDALRITSDAQAWYLKPTAFGGGEGDFVGLTLGVLGYDTGSTTTYSNINAYYGMSVASGGASMTITGCDVPKTDLVRVTVAGPEEGDITTEPHGIKRGLYTASDCP